MHVDDVPFAAPHEPHQPEWPAEVVRSLRGTTEAHCGHARLLECSDEVVLPRKDVRAGDLDASAIEGAGSRGQEVFGATGAETLDHPQNPHGHERDATVNSPPGNCRTM